MIASAGLACRSAGVGTTDGWMPSSSSTVTPSGHEHRFHRQPPVAAPVHVLQVQDQRELVQHERGAQAEQGGRAGPPVQRPVRGDDAGDAADQHEHDAEHHVVHVQVARRDVARPPADVGADHPDGKPDEPEAGHERDKEAEQRKPSCFHDLRAEPAGHAAPTNRADGCRCVITGAYAIETGWRPARPIVPGRLMLWLWESGGRSSDMPAARRRCSRPRRSVCSVWLGSVWPGPGGRGGCGGGRASGPYRGQLHLGRRLRQPDGRAAGLPAVPHARHLLRAVRPGLRAGHRSGLHPGRRT